MSDRTVASAVQHRLGSDALGRLRSLRRRLWWRRSVRSGVLALAATVLGVALVQLGARAVPFEHAVLVQARRRRTSGSLAWMVARPPLASDAGRGRTARGRGAGPAPAAGHGRSSWPDTSPTIPLEARQLADARARLNAVDLRGAFRPRLARRPLAVVGAGMAMTLLLVAWPNPQDGVIDQRRAAREAAERVAERIEDVADEVGEENVDNPDPASRGARATAPRAGPPASRAGRRSRGDARPDRLGPGGAVAHDRSAGSRARRGLTQLARSDLAGRDRRRGGKPRRRSGAGRQ